MPVLAQGGLSFIFGVRNHVRTGMKVKANGFSRADSILIRHCACPTVNKGENQADAGLLDGQGG